MVNIIPDRIRRIVTREERFALGNRSAKVISVCAQKGGVGKTTTAVSLACALSMAQRHRVLLVDMDSQGPVGASLAGEIRAGAESSLSDVLLGKRRDLMEIVVPTEVEQLWVTPSDKNLNETEGLLATRIGKEFLLKGVMATARTRFDVIILDCPPNLGNLTLNALLASDHMLVPCDMSILSVEGVHDLLETIDTIRDRLAHELRILGLLRTRVDRRNTRVNSGIQEIMDSHYGELLLDTEIPTSTALAKAQMAGTPVFRFEPSSTGARAYVDLASELSRRLHLALRAVN